MSKTQEELAREGKAHRDRHEPNCAACKTYHGSETALVQCLTREVIRLQALVSKPAES